MRIRRFSNGCPTGNGGRLVLRSVWVNGQIGATRMSSRHWKSKLRLSLSRGVVGGDVKCTERALQDVTNCLLPPYFPSCHSTTTMSSLSRDSAWCSASISLSFHCRLSDEQIGAVNWRRVTQHCAHKNRVTQQCAHCTNNIVWRIPSIKTSCLQQYQ